MDFRLIKDDYYQHIVKRLQQMVPEFETIFDNEEVYLVLEEFGEFIVLNIHNEDILKKCILFINEAIELGKHKTEDAIAQVFQIINDSDQVSFKVGEFLSSKALKLYSKYISE